MKHKCEVFRVNKGERGWGVKADGKIVSKNFLDYEADAQKRQIEMLPEDMQDEILKEWRNNNE